MIPHRRLKPFLKMRTLVTCLVVTSLCCSSDAASTNTACPAGCQCNDELLKTVCNEYKLGEVPITLNPRVQHLTLRNNHIKVADTATLQFYTSLQYLDFSYNQLMTVPAKTFSSQGQLTELLLDHNKLSNITMGTFFNLQNLVVLNLRNNLLDNLPDRIFSHLKALRELDLSQNLIEFISVDAFKGLASLQILKLDDNMLKQVPTHAFHPLGTLAELRIGSHAFHTLANDSFHGLKSLSALYLKGCDISKISQTAFAGLANNLRILDLTDNQLETIPTDQLSQLGRLEELNIGQNGFLSLPKDSFKGLKKLRKINISGASNLSHVESGVFQENMNLDTIEMVSNKRLKTMADDVFTGLPNLKHLVLRDNNFDSFKESLAAWPVLQHLDLSENPVLCDCSLTWLRDLQKQRNTNSSSILCDSPSSHKYKTLKQLTDEELNCSSYTSNEQTLIGVVCGVAVAVVVILVFLMYRYRHKVRDIFKNYEWNKQTKVTNSKQAEYQKTFNDDEFIIRAGHPRLPHHNHSSHPLKPIPVTEL